MSSFETKNLIVRRFQPSDWKDVQEIAVAKESSAFAYADQPWPVSEKECRELCGYFAEKDYFLAIEEKASGRVIGFIALNGINEEKILDIGHVINLNYAGKGYEREALKPVFDSAFTDFGVEGIEAHWALADKVKIEPLQQLGMKVVKTFSNEKFSRRPGDTERDFEACTLFLSKADWPPQNP